MQAYDAAMLIDSALKATGGKTSDPNGTARGARRKPTSNLCAASSSSAPTITPMQDFYLTKVAKRADGKYAD